MNNFNVNSQLNLSKKSSHPNTQHVKQNTFSYGHQGSQHSQMDTVATGNSKGKPNLDGLTNSRNGPRGDSFNENGGPGGSQFHGDTGHDYNIQQQEQLQGGAQAGEYPRRQIVAMTNANQPAIGGGSQSKSRGRQI